ncbi:hypothetical protein QQF64_029625 [Cirrhinus molitorella]|uniref:Uncharacterized protein n=1 Tax=Cirrhinus molitorella TaxID=172907 RepID=A0ABR3N137_9TELE
MNQNQNCNHLIRHDSNPKRPHLELSSKQTLRGNVDSANQKLSTARTCKLLLKPLRVKLLGYAKPSHLDLPLEFGNRIWPPHCRHFPLLVACQSMQAPSPSASTLSPHKVSVSPSADSKAYADWKPAQICSPDTFL